ncbi:MAG TPA: hypothetical protein VFJ62_05215, partial [Usitatibacter sp.]|nr:hypothetical protein [Usitatibacter sp.]
MSRPLAWARIAGALAVLIVLALFATGRAVMLAFLVAWHAGLVALPMAAVVLACIRAGMRDLTVLGLCALSAGGLAAYVLFWTWSASPTGGAVASVAWIVASAAIVGYLLARLDRDALRPAAPLGIAALAWAAYALFLLAFGLAPSGFQQPLNVVQHHFMLALPYDNELPYIFARQVAADSVATPMSLTWLASDRPPLQTAYFLASGAALLPRSEVHYQVQSTLLQALWVPGMWLLLRSFGIAPGAVFAALAAGMFSGFAFIHGLFTWPKLFPVCYLAVATAMMLNASRETLADWRVATATGTCVALAMLCHPGSAFVLVGLGVALLAMRRVPPVRFLAIAAVTAFIVAIPWALYQKHHPPG